MIACAIVVSSCIRALGCLSTGFVDLRRQRVNDWSLSAQRDSPLKKKYEPPEISAKGIRR